MVMSDLSNCVQVFDNKVYANSAAVTTMQFTCAAF